ncbi:MAG: hypothetical protein CL920_24280, partial [Deltaproteobacteria bacterium]|nr:hypothetical protein [Deltaproteobacteria bacterium]
VKTGSPTKEPVKAGSPTKESVKTGSPTKEPVKAGVPTKKAKKYKMRFPRRVGACLRPRYHMSFP